MEMRKEMIEIYNMIELKYKNINLTEYNNFLNECAEKDYSGQKINKHHILPKFMGGNNDKNNLIKLNREDHYIAHILLAECFDKETHEYTGNILGAHKILNYINKDYSINRLHPSIKQIMSKETIQKMRDAKIKTGSIILKDGKYTFSEEVLKNMSASGKQGYKEGTRKSPFQIRSENFLKRHAETRRKPGEFKHSEESKRKTSESCKGKNAGSKNGMFGKTLSEKQRKQISDKLKGRYSGGKNNRAKKTRCNSTGMIFDCAKDAAKYFNLTYDVLLYRLKVKGLFEYV